MAERAPRPLIIVGAAKVDSVLFQILNSHLFPKQARAGEQDELLEGDRPLSTFSARIKMCYRLGLLDATLYRCLEAVRSLRNPSAHALAFDINRSPTREKLADLRRGVVNRNSFSLTRQRYFDSGELKKVEELQCILLTVCVLLEAISEKVPVTKGSLSARNIAAR